MAENCHKGHRARMRSKLAEHGARIFDTYELLEMLLYYVIPFADTNPLAKRLIARFGNLGGVLAASREELMSVSGIGERASELISLVAEGFRVLELSTEQIRPVLDSYDRAGVMIREYFERNEGVNIVLVLLDNGMRILRTVALCGDNFASASVRSRDFIAQALDAGASVAIVGFTYRKGISLPTDGDRATALMLKNDLGAVGVTLAEVYSVDSLGYFGFGLDSQVLELESKALSSFYDSVPKNEGAVALSSTERGKLAEYTQGQSYISAEGGIVSRYLGALLSFAGAPQEVADMLVSEYGSLDGAFSLSVDELSRFAGMNNSRALLLKLVAYIVGRVASEELSSRTAISEERRKMLAVSLFTGLSVETVYALLIGEGGKIRGILCLGEGTVNSSDVYPRRLAEQVLRTKSVGVILAHNHPSGVAEPSREDIDSTLKLFAALRSSEVCLYSHLVVAGRYVSVISPNSEGGIGISGKQRVEGNALPRVK